MEKTFEQWFADVFQFMLEQNIQCTEEVTKRMFEDGLTPAEALQEAVEEARKF